MRVAIYYTPKQDDLLARTAARWLGRDIHGGVVAPDRPARFDEAVASARRYGFHATIKAPFRLAGGCALTDLEDALAAFCGDRAPVGVGPLALTRLDAWLALTPVSAPAELGAFAGEVVRTFDRFRAQPSEAEPARRWPERLSRDEQRNLERWGYPYVMEAFGFHMTLAGPLVAAEMGDAEAELRARFDGPAHASMTIDRLSVCVERDEPGDFVVHATVALG